MALRLPHRQAIAMEIGIHNGSLAIFIALNVLSSTALSIPAGAYSMMIFVTAGLFAWRVKVPAGEAAG